MDTASHLLFGATLAGLAYLDPAVAHHPEVSLTVLAGTLIGSHAPDFDVVFRFKGFVSYIRHHRGITHSLPALFIWPAIISLALAWGAEMWEYVFSLYGWTFLAVCWHVFLDTLNAYGVQSLRPFHKRWVHLDILSIFDPILFIGHLAGLVLWIGFKWEPVSLFVSIYAATLLYILAKGIYHYYLVQRVKRMFPQPGVCHVLPTLHWFHWLFVFEAEEQFYTGRVVGNYVSIEDQYAKTEQHPIIQATMNLDGVRAFLQFAQRIHVTYREIQGGYEVHWSEMRFWYNKKLPFGVDIQLDGQLNVVQYRIGWRKKAWEAPFV